jgi:micrococcal nuclease
VKVNVKFLLGMGAALLALLFVRCDRRQESRATSDPTGAKETTSIESATKPASAGAPGTASTDLTAPRSTDSATADTQAPPARPTGEPASGATTPASAKQDHDRAHPGAEPSGDAKKTEDKPDTHDVDKPDERPENADTTPKTDKGSEKLPPRASGKKVARVYDGDTVLLDDGHELRYIGIDAPETAKDGEAGEPLWKEAMELNKKLVNGKELILEFDRERRDSHNRLLAYVYVAGEKERERIFVNGEIVRNGLALVYRHVPNNKYDSALLKLQAEARKAKKGIWKLPPPARKEKVYVGSHRSNRFHRPSCKYAAEIANDDREEYKTRDAAFDAGKSPCRECKP